MTKDLQTNVARAIHQADGIAVWTAQRQEWAEQMAQTAIDEVFDRLATAIEEEDSFDYYTRNHVRIWLAEQREHK